VLRPTRWCAREPTKGIGGIARSTTPYAPYGPLCLPDLLYPKKTVGGGQERLAYLTVAPSSPI
jgi:hypothetical protein